MKKPTTKHETGLTHSVRLDNQTQIWVRPTHTTKRSGGWPQPEKCGWPQPTHLGRPSWAAQPNMKNPRIHLPRIAHYSFYPYALGIWAILDQSEQIQISYQIIQTMLPPKRWQIPDTKSVNYLQVDPPPQPHHLPARTGLPPWRRGTSSSMRMGIE